MKAKYLTALAAAALAAGCRKTETTTIPAQPERKLTLVQPAGVTLERGGMAKADIQIRRQDCPGDVTIRFDKLPYGVLVVDSTQKMPGDAAAFTLKASEAADLVANHVAQVTASGPGGISVSGPMEITVTEKKPATVEKPAEEQKPASPPATDKSPPADVKK